jgi:hypothetical protein
MVMGGREKDKAAGHQREQAENTRVEPPLNVSKLGTALQRADRLREQYKGKPNPAIMYMPIK